MKRTIGPNPRDSFFVSNTPLGTRLDLLVWLSEIRWTIEQSFEGEKQ